MNIKEQIKQLEKIANQKPTYGCSPPEIDEYESKARIAKQALAIIKKQEEIIELALKQLRNAHYDLGCYGAVDEKKWVQETLEKINKLLGENDK